MFCLFGLVCNGGPLVHGFVSRRSPLSVMHWFRRRPRNLTAPFPSDLRGWYRL